MRIWLDAKKPAPYVPRDPNPYYWKKEAQDVIETIQHGDFHIERLMRNGHVRFLERDYEGRSKCYAHAKKWDITEINMSKEFAESDDAKRLMEYIEELGRTDLYPIKIH